MLKQKVQKIVRDTCIANKVYHTFDRNTNWDMFCNVCDNLLKEGCITEIQHQRWTSPF